MSTTHSHLQLNGLTQSGFAQRLCFQYVLGNPHEKILQTSKMHGDTPAKESPFKVTLRSACNV